ncbi:MAG TPA: hypothetical protein VK778_16400 [Solirubrobacteraceae bacterium]|nr:hypothetical protein [Solirubrobacteraceae bacterium]
MERLAHLDRLREPRTPGEHVNRTQERWDYEATERRAEEQRQADARHRREAADELEEAEREKARQAQHLWQVEYERLAGELTIASRARDRVYEQAIDCADVIAATASIDALARREAADELVRIMQARLDAHGEGRPGARPRR